MSRRSQLLKLALVSIAIDLLLLAIQIPTWFLFLPTSILEELIEQIISTLLAKNQLQLDFFDRFIGLLPIPGITPITVRVLRELLKKP